MSAVPMSPVLVPMWLLPFCGAPQVLVEVRTRHFRPPRDNSRMVGYNRPSLTMSALSIPFLGCSLPLFLWAAVSIGLGFFLFYPFLLFLCLSPVFHRKFCARIAQERRSPTRSTHCIPSLATLLPPPREGCQFAVLESLPNPIPRLGP